jgi:cyclopropane fatty-acyl-phospholipid synthase-like methyltransferase
MDYAMQTHQSTEVVADYYDQHTAGYMTTYGEAIQAFRPTDIKTLYNYLIQSIGLKNGMHILDAGCGIGGPATYFAKKLKLDIKGITISKVQADMAKEHIKKQWWLRGKVDILQGDYHKLQDYFPSNAFDGILFLESLGHAHDLKRVIHQAYATLKSGGFIYIKDFFPFEKTDHEEQRKYQWVVDRINTAYAYNVLDLNELIQTIRRQGFEIAFIKKFDFKDDIQARAAFEEMCQIDLFGGLQEFRVAEWLEIKCIKP